MSRRPTTTATCEAVDPGRGRRAWWPSAAPTGSRCANWPGRPASHTPPRRTTSPTGAACSPRWPPRGSRLLAAALADARPRLHRRRACLCAVRPRPSRPLRGDVRQVAARRRRSRTGRRAERGAGAELARGVATLKDPGAKADPAQRRAGGVVAGARVFDAVAQRGDRHRRRPDGRRRADRVDAVRRLACGHDRNAVDRHRPNDAGRPDHHAGRLPTAPCWSSTWPRNVV